MIPQDFLDSIASLPGIDLAAFKQAMAMPPSISIKLNRRKASDIKDAGYGDLMPVPWCESGFYLDERPNFTLNPLLHAGVFYVQDASSMVYESILSSLISRGLLPHSPAVLDLCAAPGGKSTSIINALPDTSLVVANEFVPQRASILKENLLKWGFPNIIVTNSPTSRYAALGESFHLIAVDAPCSGEGMMRKDEKAVEQWSPGLVRKCTALQREILSDAVEALLPGGYLIYSTCTFNTTEDEDQLRWLRDEHGLELIEPLPGSNQVIAGSIYPDVQALRFMPHITHGEGLFVGLLRKPGELSERRDPKLADRIAAKIKVILNGIPRKQLKGKVEIPTSESVLATDFSAAKSEFPTAEVDLETALRYLRHEAIVLPADTPKNYVVITYAGHPLGLAKNIGSRANNLYPAQWRIRQQIDS